MTQEFITRQYNEFREAYNNFFNELHRKDVSPDPIKALLWLMDAFDKQGIYLQSRIQLSEQNAIETCKGIAEKIFDQEYRLRAHRWKDTMPEGKE